MAKERIQLDLSNVAQLTPRRAVEAYLQNKPEKVIDHISPSQLGKCHRAHYYKIKHIEATVKPSTPELGNFELGFIWEDIIAGAFREQGIPFTYQQSFYDPELNVKGSTDFIVGDQNEEAYMYDPKTMRSQWFWFLESKKKKGQYDPYTEHYSYFIQQGTYLLLAKRKNLKIGKSQLTFISKDDSMIGAEVDIKLTAALEKEILKRIADLNHYLEHDILPPCTCDGWLVGYCDYGNPASAQANSKGRVAPTECCGTPEEIEMWRNSK